MYDSFLFGYGLTLAISKELSKSSLVTSHQKQILYFDSLFRTFVNSKDDEQIYRQFLRRYGVNSSFYSLHEKMKSNLNTKMEEIINYGVERWVGKNLFNPNNKTSSDEIMYFYLLYGYWGHLMHTEILRMSNVQKILRTKAKKILKVIGVPKNVFTTNFDTVLDKYLSPQHLHGTFPHPLANASEIILKRFPNGKDLEYSFLFGANGIEKLLRLNEIYKMEQNKYQLDFFFNPQINLGHLLIYGLSFGRTEFTTDEFLKAYPKYENDYYYRSVDGHILFTLNNKYQKGLLSKVTVSYYTPKDLEHLKHFLSMTSFMPIVEFKSANDIFQF